MPIIIVILGIIITAIIGAWYMMPGDRMQQNETAPEITETTSTPANEVIVPTDQIFASGSFEGAGSYTSDTDTEHTITVVLTVEDDMVTNSQISFDGLPDGEFTNEEQENFYNSYTSEVIGQPLEIISLSLVGGVTAPSVGFNEALAKVTTQAKKENP